MIVTERLPLFPLGTVLFPGLVLPLHIFEERYRTLVKDLLSSPEGAPRRFGVIGIRAGHEIGDAGVPDLYEVGCVAELYKVEAYEDGRYDIVTRGDTRFRLHEVDSSGPYLRGEVELLGEPVGVDAAVRTGEVAGLFGRYQQALRALQGQVPGDPPDLPADPLVLSYLVAATMILDPLDKQQLLGAPDAAERLRLERRLLRRETAILTALPSLPAVDLLRRSVSSN
jgi:Lon protease-like protein